MAGQDLAVAPPTPYGAIRDGAVGVVDGKIEWIGPAIELGDVTAGVESGRYGATHDCGGGCKLFCTSPACASLLTLAAPLSCSRQG